MLQVNLQNNRLWMVLLSLIVLLGIVACSGGTPAQPAATEAPAAAVEATEAPAEQEVAEATEAPAEEAAPESAEEPAADATAAPAEESSAAGGTTTYVIDPTQSEARFVLTEMLMGTHTVVTGTGNGIEGTVTVNFDDYSQSTISPIVIDASLLATNNNMRNGQIRRAILQTNQPEFQFITFTPTAVEGFPEDATVGEPFDLTVTGDLTIRTITQPMTFEVTVTPVTESELHGKARTTLLRQDFDLQIPRVPSVADVSEEVLLQFDFVALAQ